MKNIGNSKFPNVNKCNSCKFQFSDLNKSLVEEKKEIRSNASEERGLAAKEETKINYGNQKAYTSNKDTVEISPSSNFLFLQCNKRHEIKILEKEYVLASKNCDQCLCLLLTTDKIDFCIKCREKFDITKERCSICRNICIKCQLKTYEYSNHKNICLICQKNSSLLSKCQKCKNIFEKSKLFQIPRCEDHIYCEDCLGKYASKAVNCGICETYFSKINETFNEKELACNLCFSYPQKGKLTCQKHQYCDICYEHMKNIGISKFPRVNNCEDCKNQFIQLHRPAFPEEEIKVKEEEKNIMANEYQNIPARTTQDTSGNKLFNSFDLQQNSGNKNQIGNIMDSSRTIGMQIKPTDPASIKYHQTIRVSYSSESNKLSNVLSQKEKNLHNDAISGENTASRMLRNDSIFLTALCSFCKTQESFIAFKCNHNYCIECIVFNGGSQILNLFKMLQSGQNNAPSIFQHYCMKEDCKKKITIPCILIYNLLFSLLSNQQSISDTSRIEKLYDLYSIFSSPEMPYWIPYLDGIKYKLVFSN